MPDEDYKIRFVSEADLGAAKRAAEATRDVGKAADQAHTHTSKLGQQLRALNHELGRVPILGEAAQILRHPFLLAAVAIGFAVARLREFFAAVEAAAQKAARFGDFIATMESVKVKMASLRTESHAFDEAIAKAGDTTKTAADRQKEWNEQLSLTARLQAELVDKELAAQLSEIEGRTDIGPAGKSRLKAKAEADAPERKRKIDEDKRTRTIWGLSFGARESGVEAAGYRTQFEGLTGPLAEAQVRAEKAQERLDEAGGDLKEKAPELRKKLREIDEHEDAYRRRQFGTWYRPGMTLESFSEQRKAVQGELDALKNDRNNARLELRNAQDQIKELEQRRSDLQSKATAATTSARDMQKEAGKLTEESARSRPLEAAGVAAQGRKSAAEIGEAERQERIEILKKQRSILESQMGEVPLPADKLRRDRLNAEIEGLEAGSPEMKELNRYQKQVEDQRRTIEIYEKIFRQIGPAAGGMINFPGAPLPPPSMGGARADAALDRSVSAEEKIVACVEGIAMSLERTAERIDVHRDHAEWIANSSTG